MRISYKLIGGITILLCLSAIIGGVGFYQIINMSDKINAVSNKHAIAINSIDLMMFDADSMVRMMYLYVDGFTDETRLVTTRDRFDSYVTDFNNQTTVLQEKLPEHEDKINQVLSYHNQIVNLCITPQTGIFDIMDEIWENLGNIENDFTQMMNSIDSLISQESNANMITNATSLKYYFFNQILLVNKYVALGEDYSYSSKKIKTDFSTNSQYFSSSITHLLAGSNNVTLVNIIDSDYKLFETSILATESGIFSLYDLKTQNYNIIHANFPLLLVLLTEIQEIETGAINRAMNDTNRAVQEAAIMLISVMVVVIISGVFIGTSIIRAIIGPVNKLKTVAAEVTTGNLNVDLEEIGENDDELGMLASSFKTMISSTKNMLLQINEASAKIASTAEIIASTTEEMNASIEQITATAQQMSIGVRVQTEKSTNAIQRISNLSEIVDASIRRISNTSRTIQEISYETNILALNASIEAARAGEYGRGFGVVAAKVRDLADNSKTSAIEIDSITNEVFTNLNESTFAIKECVREISAVTEDHSASTEEVAASMEEITSVMNESAITSQELADLSEILSIAVGKFKL